VELKIVGLSGWGMWPQAMPLNYWDGSSMTAMLPWPGYQQTSRDIHWTTPALVDWIDQQCCSAHGEHPLHLVGWSMGGLLALCYTLAFPHRVARLELWGATPCFMAKEGWPGKTIEEVKPLRESIHGCQEEGFRRFLNSQIPLALSHREARRVWQSQQKEWGQPLWKGLQDSLDWFLGMDLRDALSSIVVPTDIHHGTDDSIVPYAVAEHLLRLLPQATLHSHFGKGHVIWL
jgi:pimeloyl-[acyl-carrier protein] methyl ester esterase